MLEAAPITWWIDCMLWLSLLLLGPEAAYVHTSPVLDLLQLGSVQLGRPAAGSSIGFTVLPTFLA